MYVWHCAGTKAGNILKLIVPYLIIKKTQVELGLDYLENFGSGRIGGKGSKRSSVEKQLQELYYIKMKLLKTEEA